jgi:membrane protein DedA with SNARE-associated domain
MLSELIHDYGYLAIFVGTFLEGETILALGGLAAHQGLLSLPCVMAAAFGGSLFGDQLYFFIGRRYGTRILQKRPSWVAKRERFDRIFCKYDVPSILIFRFLYGLRTIAPFAIGMSSVNTKKFVALNVIGALIWSIGLGYLGYLFGHGIELIIDDVKEYQLIVFALVAGAAALLWAWRAFRKRSSPS